MTLPFDICRCMTPCAIAAQCRRTEPGRERMQAATAIQLMNDDNARLREALAKIADGYGPNHLSKFARDIARAALAAPTPTPTPVAASAAGETDSKGERE